MGEPAGGRRGGSRGVLTRTAAYLQSAMKKTPETCPICLFVAESMKAQIDSLFYENVNDPPTREAVRAARGYCRHHARLISQHSDALGTGIIMKDVLTNELRDFEDGLYDRPGRPDGPLASLLRAGGRPDARGRCPLCQGEQNLEELATDSLLEAMNEDGFARVFGESGRLCMPHFRLAWTRCKDGAVWTLVRDRERAALEALVTELSELIRKYDHRFTDEPRGEETTSWRRALNVTSSWVDD